MIEDNTPTYTVSDLSYSLKQTIETSFSHIKIRGEFGRVTKAQSGHVYLDMKDEKAVLSSIIWKGTIAKLKHSPETGMEVIATGRLTTFPGRSQYQFILEYFELAGVGALMKLLEERKQKLAEQGFFAPEQKQKLPFCPTVIGVITSPTGAVIRDILHRISDRFPAHILLWPVQVQGEGAAEAITKAIEGFNQFPASLPKPELIIVARGGGSLEDLWAFNEENIVKAAFASSLPLISAIGHETDWTLLDWVADYRAPTPTGAAEIAVPVRLDLAAQIQDLGLRGKKALFRNLKQSHSEFYSLRARFTEPEHFLNTPRQSLDHISERFKTSLSTYLRLQKQRLKISEKGLTPNLLQKTLIHQKRILKDQKNRLNEALKHQISTSRARLEAKLGLLEALSHKEVLKRGYALVKGEKNRLVRRAETLKQGEQVSLLFYDGIRPAEIISSVKTTLLKNQIHSPEENKKPVQEKKEKKRKEGTKKEISHNTLIQGQLF